MPVELDMNTPEFQASLFILEKTELVQVVGTLRKLLQMEWSQIYQDKGLNWEYIDTRKFYTFRASQKIRVSAVREGNRLRLLAVHADHDSAYE